MSENVFFLQLHSKFGEILTALQDVHDLKKKIKIKKHSNKMKLKIGRRKM